MKALQHFSALAVISIIMGLIYVAVQQNYRSNANDPQIKIAHDLRDRLESGRSAGSLVFRDTIDLEKSLGTFVIAYDQRERPIQSSGILNGRLPQLPVGVFDFVKTHGEDWVTWQPQHNVRMAMGIIKVNASPISYIAVGRSLREVEERVSRLTTMIVICWILCMAIVLMNWLIQHYFNRKSIVA